jgi:hypothetical protein
MLLIHRFFWSNIGLFLLLLLLTLVLKGENFVLALNYVNIWKSTALIITQKNLISQSGEEEIDQEKICKDKRVRKK